MRHETLNAFSHLEHLCGLLAAAGPVKHCKLHHPRRNVYTGMKLKPLAGELLVEPFLTLVRPSPKCSTLQAIPTTHQLLLGLQRVFLPLCGQLSTAQYFAQIPLGVGG